MAATETLLIQGKSVPYHRGSVPVSDCLLDPQNPRIQFLAISAQPLEKV